MTFPMNSDVTITIGGVDVTANVRPESLSINSAITSKVDTCRFILRYAGGINSSAWREVVVLDGAKKVFGGYVLTPDEKEGESLQLEKLVSCSDYACLFDHVLVTEEYENQSDADILALLFAEYLPSLGYNATTYVNELLEHDLIRFNKVYLRQAIETLTKLSGAEWYVDADKNLHYFATEEFSAPFAISDAPDLISSYPCSNLKVVRDGAKITNRVDVVGGYYLGVAVEDLIAGTGQSNVVNVPLKLHKPDGESAIQVWRNDGTEGTPVWTELTVKTAYVDELTGANDVLYYFEEKSLEQLSNFPELPNAVKVYGRPEIPLFVRAKSQASKDFYGFWLDYKIVNNGQLSQEVAKSMARSKIAESAFADEALSFDVQMPELLAGQKISVTNELHSLDADWFLVSAVTIKIGIDGKTISKVRAGVYDADLIDLLRSLFLSSQEEIEWKDDEVLLLIFQQDEQISLSETVDTDPEQFTDPYYYTPTDSDPDAGFYPEFAYTPTE